MEGDFGTLSIHVPAQDFNPRPPHGGRQGFPCGSGVCLNISIHALRMEGDYLTVIKRYGKEISIHALRMEGDH